MKIFIYFLASQFLLASHAIAVDESSSSYTAGNLLGKVFIVVLIVLIIKKYILKK